MELITITFQKHDSTVQRTENISLNVKLSEFRKAAQKLLGFPEREPCVLVLLRTKVALGNEGTFKDAGIQQNDKLILCPSSLREKYVLPLPNPHQDPVISTSTPSNENPSPPNPTTPRISSPLNKPNSNKAVIRSTCSTVVKVTKQTYKQAASSFSASVRQLNRYRIDRLSPQIQKNRRILEVVGAAAAALILISVASNTPEQAVRDLFSNIDNGQYQAAWERLSPQLQKNKKLMPLGYSVDWWQKVDRVEIDNVNLGLQNDDSAIVNVKLKLFMKNGKVFRMSRRLGLVRDTKTGRWIINSSKPLS